MTRWISGAEVWRQLRLQLSNFIKYKTMDTPKTVNILIQRFE